jgi:hypothetical protein
MFDQETTIRNLKIIAVAAFLSTAIYVLISYLYFRMGYPLDDSWIYQTYARNLSQRGEWAFVPGKASGGSTGPLWVLFLTIGYFVRLDHHIWAYILGSVTLFGIGAVGLYSFRLLQPDLQKWGLLAGLILVLEWHLIWASASGMETLFFALIATFTLVYLFRNNINQREWLLIGFLIGISVWIRPDGITLLGPAGLVILLGTKNSAAQKITQCLILSVGFGIPFGLYLVFNLITSGSVWPNTFYAKQAEYAQLKSIIPFQTRLAQQLITPLAGIGIMLLPGFFYTLYSAVKKRRWGIIAGIIWLFGYLGIYAWRLPVTYQHGRYIIPSMPIYFILGSAGALAWISLHLRDNQMILRVFSKVWLISSLCALGLFWLLGAKAYAEDVAIIESEMVTTAIWIKQNITPDAVIAAHDIGALGYYSQHDIVDLAGLISPDVIPFIRDELKLADYLDIQEADYLMTFPNWYPELVSRSPLLYQTEGAFSPMMGGENMAIYLWISSDSE